MKTVDILKGREGKNLLIRFTYDPAVVQQMRMLPPGRRWVKEIKAWTCPPSRDAFGLLKGWGFEFTQKALELEKEFLSPRTKKIPIKPIQVEGLKKTLRPFQEEGVGFIQAHGGKVLLADEMGLGKTIQALAWLQHNPEACPAVVICPASVKGVWELETKSSTDLSCQVLSGRTEKLQSLAQINIINYDIVDGWAEALKDCKTIILDEAHKIKNQKAKRTKAVMALATRKNHIIALSGTPIVNRPIEFFTTLKILAPTKFGGFWSFAQTYCGATHNGYGWDFTGASNTEELHSILTNSIMIRRLKKEVLKELPDKIHSTIPIPLNGNKSFYEATVQEALGLLEDSDSQLKDITAISKLRQAAVEAKLPACQEWIDNFLETDKKLVVFCVHHKTIDELKKIYGTKALAFDGRTPQKCRAEIVEQFQTDPKIKLFIGNIQAAGVGITLSAASDVLFMELPWTPGELIQAEDRCHRIGQKESVNIYYAITQETLEEDMIELLSEKQKILDQVLDGKEIGKDKNIFEEIIQRIKRK